MTRLLAIAATLAGCVHAPRLAPPAAPPPRPVCALVGTPEILVAQDGAVLERWEVAADDVLFSPTLPDDAGYARYRKTLHDAHADLLHPVADPPTIDTDELREVWRREDLNLATAYGGEAGTIRPIHCLEAALFAQQHARVDELADPTELVALLLDKTIGDRPRLRVYVGHGPGKYPARTVYGDDHLAADRADGWRLFAHLHNHTIRTNAGAPALGVTAPSTNDVELLRGLAAEHGLEAAWVTNGVFTIEIPAAALARYQTRVR